MRLTWPAAERNKAVVLDALRPHLPTQGQVLEVASGTGQHTAHFAAALPGLRFQPTDLKADQLASIDAWTRDLPNVAPAMILDTTAAWPTGPFDVVYCANMIHIAPWTAAEGLLSGVGQVLAPDGVFCLYGPFRIDGTYSDSNARFHAGLQSRDPSWGVRDLEAVEALADTAGLRRTHLIAMPANNHLVIFRR
jgi:SAM-dependent methyltransferase